jgi:hypothetical protein
MENLELEHILPYLPYSLKIIDKYGNKCNISYLSKKKIAYISIRGIGEVQKLTWTYSATRTKPLIKPILKPLSDLTKDKYFKLSGETEGQCFGFWYGKYNGDSDKREFIHHEGYSSKVYFLNNGYGQFPYRMMQFFFKNHFDIFGLIPKGLAIDINTI